jgi:hypothetical protein
MVKIRQKLIFDSKLNQLAPFTMQVPYQRPADDTKVNQISVIDPVTYGKNYADSILNHSSSLNLTDQFSARPCFFSLRTTVGWLVPSTDANWRVVRQFCMAFCRMDFSS